MKKRANNKQSNHNSKALKEKALKVSIKEGIAASLSTNVGDGYIIPAALAVNATSTQIGFLSSFSLFLYQLSQILGVKLMGIFPRKKVVLYFVILQAIMWLFISAVIFAVWKGWFDGYSIWLLIASYSILMALGGVSHPGWFSWMGDIVPDETRGQYFAKRNRIVSSFGITMAIIAALFLDYFKTKGYALLAFSILFTLASLFKFVSYIYLHKQYAPHYVQKKKDYFSLISFIERFDNFGKFAIYQGAFNFAIMIASPFFSVYMLRELGFSYTIFIATSVSYTIFYLLLLSFAGKFSDKYGNKKLTIIANIFFVLTPIFYIIFKSPLWIILIPQLTAAIANAASVISFSNFIYDSVKPNHRGLCAAYTNVIVGVGILLGAITGGLIVDYWHPSSVNPYIFVFSIAVILRLSVALIFLPSIKEVKKVKNLPSNLHFLTALTHYLHIEHAKTAHFHGKFLGKFTK